MICLVDNLMKNNQQSLLRNPHNVMQLKRMGSFHQTRLSFMRQLLRRITRENWKFTNQLWDICEKGFGVAVRSVSSLDRTYSW